MNQKRTGASRNIEWGGQRTGQENLDWHPLLGRRRHNTTPHVDKSYTVDTAHQLDIYFPTLLDYTWKNSQTVEQYVAGLRSSFDKIANVNLDNKLKVHLLLREAIAWKKHVGWSSQRRLSNYRYNCIHAQGVHQYDTR